MNTPTNDLSILDYGAESAERDLGAIRDTFDELYTEGKRGSPKWIELVLHAHMAGRPTLIPTIRRCIAYAKQRDNVWFARKRDIAEWAIKRHNASA